MLFASKELLSSITQVLIYEKAAENTIMTNEMCKYHNDNRSAYMNIRKNLVVCFFMTRLFSIHFTHLDVVVMF